VGDVNLVINDKDVKAQEGMTILEAAQSAGIDIPTLCHHEQLAPYGACRLCTVEIFRGRRSRLVTSCAYPVEEGLIVKTESEPVIKGRKMLLELILTRWPWVDKSMLEKCGLERTRFEENTTFCILCGLCVRYCAEVKKANVLGFVGRGIKRQVVIYPELAAEVCPSCDDGWMECRSVCPTGVIPNDFALTGINLARKVPLPIAHPVRTFDQDNIREIRRTVGDL